MTPILVRRTGGDPAALLAAGLPPLLARLYATRGITDPAALDHRLAAMARPDGLPGLAAAVAVLAAALQGGQRILVVGDFDADGATSSALAVHALRAMGADADFLVPDRFKLGYGLSPELVAIASRGDPAVLLTVDNGISSVEGVAAANAAGMQVVVTDHHLPGPLLPAAAALVNPRLPENSFAGSNVAGVGVVFYVLGALRRALLDDGWFSADRPAPNMASYLDLVALGTVADLVALDQPNRVLVQEGLRRMRAGRARPGIVALAQVAGRDLTRAQASDLGYGLAPRLNAAGRLTDMTTGIRCLLADDLPQALALATELDSLNRERQRIEAEMGSDADRLLADLEVAGDLPAGLCLSQPGWHQGVVGILASRIKERVHRPVVAFAPGEDGSLKGSGRSVAGFHIRDALADIAAANPGLVQRFGGHAMAAGLTLAADGFSTFEAAFARLAAHHFGPAGPSAEVVTDGELAPEELDLDHAQLLEQGGPWGQQFPEPQFEGTFEVLSARAVGAGGDHAKLLLAQPGGRQLAAIAFRTVCPERGARIRAVYKLVVNRFRGQANAELVLEHLLPA